MRSRILAIVVAVVVPIAALGVVISRGGSSSHTPARLPIVSGGGGGKAPPRCRPRRRRSTPYGAIVYKAGANLPELDGSARAYKTAAFDPASARKLADALGFNDAAPDANSTFTNGDAQLTVSPSGFWGYTRQSSGGSVASSGVAVACAPNTDCPIPPTTVPQHPADLPSQEDAKATALALLESAGIDTTHAVINVDDAITQWAVRVDPILDGVPTEGFTTTVTVGERSVIDYASGILGRPEAADSYPLIGTSAAIDRLNKGEGFVGPRPMMAEPALTAGGSSVEGAPGSESGGSSVDGAPGSVGGAEPAPLPPCPESAATTTLPCGSPLQSPGD